MTSGDERLAGRLRALKTVARSLNVPVLVTVPLKDIEPSSLHARVWPPRLGECTELISAELYSDVVLLLHREELYMTLEQWSEQHPDLPESAYPKGVAQIIIAKHRNGPTGSVELRFRDKLAKFEDWVLHRDDDDE